MKLHGVQFINRVLVQGILVETTGEGYEAEQMDTFPWVLVWKKNGSKAHGRVTTVFNICSRGVEESDLVTPPPEPKAKK